MLDESCSLNTTITTNKKPVMSRTLNHKPTIITHSVNCLNPTAIVNVTVILYYAIQCVFVFHMKGVANEVLEQLYV